MDEHPSAVAPGPVPRSVQAAAAWSWRILLIAALAAGAFWLLARLSAILVPVAAALLLAVLLTPLRALLERRCRLPRSLAVAVSVVGMLATIVALVWTAGQQLVQGFTNLADQAVAGFDQARAWLFDGPLGIEAEQIETYWQQASDFLAGGDWIGPVATGALGAAMTAGQVLIALLVTVFCTIFFLHDGARIWAWTLRLLPRSAREPVHQAGRRAVVTLSAYVRTQALVALVEAVGIGIGAAFFVPGPAVPLAILVFFGAFIPFAGALITGAIAVAVVLVAQGWVAALVMLAVLVAVNQAESHLLQPLMMGHAVSLHPVAVALVVATGSLIAGVMGALFAVPVAAVLNTVVLYLAGTDKFPELASGSDDGGGSDDDGSDDDDDAAAGVPELVTV